MARKRKFNPSGAQVALAAGAAVLAGLVAYDVYAKPKAKPKKKKKGPACDPSPYVWDEAAARDSIEALVAEGERDATLIAAEVSIFLFGDYPGGGNVEFPPAPDAPKGVACVWSLVVYMVEIIFKEKGIKEGEKKGDFNWEVHGGGDIDNYPWENPSLHPQNYPTPGVFINLADKTGSWDPADGYDSMVKAALGSAIAMANSVGGNVDIGLATSNSTQGKNLRKQMRQLISCSLWNDALYGQTSAGKAGGKDPTDDDPGVTYMMNSKGRGINQQPNHADNLTRMAQGKKPKRTTSLSGNKLAAPNRGSNNALVWLPAVDLIALGGVVPVVKPMDWSNNTSTKEPPPVVQDLGIDMSGVGLPGGPGC